MRKFIALTRKEAATILLSPPILFASAFFVLLDSFAFYMTVVTPATAYATFDEIALFMLFTSIIILPLVSMHSFSEDNAGGTLETLLTAPIGNYTAVLAKYTGAMLFVVLILLHGVVYAALLAYGGNLDWNAAATAFLALFAVGSLAVSLGVFVSALTISPAAAAAGTGGILVFMAVAADIDPYSGSIANILNSISFIPHAKRWIAGELDTRGLAYFLSITAMFLFYARLAVGSRGIGKRSVDPTVRRRLVVTYTLVCTGFILLVVQVALLHIKGFWESGTPFMGPGQGRAPWAWLTPAGLSLAAFCWSYLTFRAARRAERGRRGTRIRRYATISESRVMAAPRYYYEENLRGRRRIWISAVAALVIVLNLNWLANYPFRTFSDSVDWKFLTWLQGRTWDVTEDRRNSLSPTTRRTLDGLQGRVQIYSFLAESQDTRGVPVAEEMRRLLGRYNDYNAQVIATFADAVREPELAAGLAEEVGAPAEGLDKLLIVDYQGRRLPVPAAALVAPPDWRAQMAGDSDWVFDGENRLTQTIMRLADPRVPNVFFTYGHLEHSLVAGPYPDRSISRLARAMAAANMRVRQHLMSASRPIPADCDILVVASPRVPYQDHEAGEIRRFLDRGGRLLLFGPVAGPEYLASDDALSPLLFSLGGDFRDDVVEDDHNNDNGQALAPLGKTRGTGEGLINFVFPLSRSIRDNPRSVADGWTSERMIESHTASRATNFADGAVRPGPFTLLYRATRETDTREARAVVVASGRMAADSDIVRGANEALLMGMTQWLAGREESRDIAPRAWVDRRLILTGPQHRAILWIGVVALPLAWLLAGISVWWMRRD